MLGTVVEVSPTSTLARTGHGLQRRVQACQQLCFNPVNARAILDSVAVAVDKADAKVTACIEESL